MPPQRRVGGPAAGGRGPPSSSDVRSEDLETTFDIDGHIETTVPTALGADPRKQAPPSQHSAA